MADGRELFPDSAFKLIDAGARTGEPFLVRRGPEYARAYWSADLWAYDIPGGVHQIDFEPTHYAELVRA